jgi:NitT/TauT family transport system substrate-binding protein
MNRSAKTWGIVAAVVAGLALLGLLRYRTAARPTSHEEETFHQAPTTAGGGGATRQTLTVAFVPVTCHLTCPVTDFASKTSTTGTEFDALRFTEFPSIVEALRSKKLEAAFLTVPLAMKMREQGVPVKICCLGHRDGSQVMVHKDNPAKGIRDMKGKIIAIPSPFSNENFFIRKLMQDQGMKPDDIQFVVMAPPDMPIALQTKSIDGFVVAEPFCSKAELDGYGRVLYYAKDIWPHYISCALVVHEDLIKEQPEVVKDLVRGIVESGEWAQTHRPEAAKVVAPYFKQNEKLINYVLTQPPDRVSYRMLTPGDEEMQRIEDMGIALGVLKKRTPMSELMDKRFIPEKIVPAEIDMSKLGTVKIMEKS